MFSHTDSRGKMLVTWKLRERPRRLTWCGGSPVISSPLSCTVPEVGARRPLIRLNSVDFPAPFGPMIAWRSPVGTLRLTPRMIWVAPKSFCKSTSLIAAALISFAPRRAHAQAHHPTRRPPPAM